MLLTRAGSVGAYELNFFTWAIRLDFFLAALFLGMSPLLEYSSRRDMTLLRFLDATSGSVADMTFLMAVFRFDMLDLFFKRRLALEITSFLEDFMFGNFAFLRM